MRLWKWQEKRGRTLEEISHYAWHWSGFERHWRLVAKQTMLWRYQAFGKSKETMQIT